MVGIATLSLILLAGVEKTLGDEDGYDRTDDVYGSTASNADAMCNVDAACPAATCAEARDDYGADVDGFYTLSLKVDAVRIAAYTASQQQGCGIRECVRGQHGEHCLGYDEADPSNWPTRLVSSYQGAGGYSPNSKKCMVPTTLLDVNTDLKVIRTDQKVWCHMMGKGPKVAGETPRAYVAVDAGSNKAQFQYGLTMFTTSFSKLRFDEGTQLIHTADCK